jgi:hypothetical protein
MISSLGFFWLFLAVAFFAMAWRTYRVRKVLVPKVIEESRGKVAAISFGGEGIPVADLRKLKPIFDHTLAIEIAAFVLTGIASIVDFLHG